jgi:YD repeat-containing protein
MTRRKGMIAALAAICGIMSDTAKTAETTDKSGWTWNHDANGNLVSITRPKGAITFPLDTYTEFVFTLDKEEVRLSPAEVFAALKAP